MQGIRSSRRRISKTLRRRFSSKSDTSTPSTKNVAPSSNRIVGANEKKISIDMHIAERKSQSNNEQYNVFYKDDLERFERRYTLKLKTFTEYDVRIDIEPRVNVQYVKLGGRKYEMNEVVGNHNEDKSVYSLVWSTKKIEITERKYRTILPCALMFDDCQEVRFHLMVKFYDAEEDVHCKGIPLSSLNLDVIMGKSNNDKTYICDLQYK